MPPELLLSQILAMKSSRHNTSSISFHSIWSDFQYLLLLEKSLVKYPTYRTTPTIPSHSKACYKSQMYYRMYNITLKKKCLFVFKVMSIHKNSIYQINLWLVSCHLFNTTCQWNSVVKLTTDPRNAHNRKPLEKMAWSTCDCEWGGRKQTGAHPPPAVVLYCSRCKALQNPMEKGHFFFCSPREKQRDIQKAVNKLIVLPFILCIFGIANSIMLGSICSTQQHTEI